MKAYAPLTYGRRETRKLRERVISDPLIQRIYSYLEKQRTFFNENIQLRDKKYPTSIILPRHFKIGLHNHFPEKKDWYSRALKIFNPDKLEEFAYQAYLQGFDVITVSNRKDDRIFGNERGVEFKFGDKKVVVLKAQERGHIHPFGYEGRIETESIDDIISSAIDQGGLVLLCHPSNKSYHGLGEDVVIKYSDKVILETQSPLVNHPSLRLDFADIIAKEWSLKHKVPGVSVIDSRNLHFEGGFFVPEEYLDISSPEAVIRSLRELFKKRTEELKREESLDSIYIKNIEDYPALDKIIAPELFRSVATSVKNLPRRFFYSLLKLKNKSVRLSKLDYIGVRDNKLDIFDGKAHVYILEGENPAKEFIEKSNNLVFYPRGGKIYIGNNFSEVQGFDENTNLESFLESKFNPNQIAFFREISSNPRFKEFQTGMHPVYIIACVKPNGEKPMFVGKEFLPKYNKGDAVQRFFFRMYNKFVLKGEEALRLASIQSTLLENGINVVPPLYVEYSKGRGRIISPYYRFESLDGNYSKTSEKERREKLEHAADYLAFIKSKGVYLPDMHLGNIAKKKGDWFKEHKDKKPIIPDVNVAGASLITFGDSSYNLVNPITYFFSPRITFIRKAKRPQHRLIQSRSDIDFFNRIYKEKLESYRAKG